MPVNHHDKQIGKPIVFESIIPKNREDLLKWNGWGYKDSGFVLIDNATAIMFSGKRYPVSGLRLPHFLGWAKAVFNVDLSSPVNVSQPPPTEHQYPPANITEENLTTLSTFGITYSTKVIDRLMRAHGQTLHDIFTLWKSKFPRIPDVVVWPTCHEDVVKLVTFATERDIVIIPYGGGTAVSGAVECPAAEQRTIISLDTSQMNRILWLDKENLVACCESGIVGQDLEKVLAKLGYTSGHEPDSYEFSSLGGWVATRASGMKKNVYGNIEDLLVHVRLVTSKGVLEKNCQVPRMSCGPDFNHVVLGSEGSLGVITEVIIKVRPLPKSRKYGSIVFPNFESGVKCMREIAKKRWQPASIRLMDNGQFQFGAILKPENSYFGLILEGLSKFYITKIKGFDINEMCVMTLLFEGDEDEVKINHQKIIGVAKMFGGISAGEKNGERGYMLTFVIAYIRDLGLEYNVLADSFETSVPWDRTLALVRNVKEVVRNECARLGIRYYLFNCRVTQTYDAGCVIYFYLGFNFEKNPDPVGLHHEIEVKARNEILACGGSISHHHGVGKLRSQWYPTTVSQVGVDLYMSAKRELDPKNIFATNNLVPSKL